MTDTTTLAAALAKSLDSRTYHAILDQLLTIDDLRAVTDQEAAAGRELFEAMSSHRPELAGPAETVFGDDEADDDPVIGPEMSRARANLARLGLPAEPERRTYRHPEGCECPLCNKGARR